MAAASYTSDAGLSSFLELAVTGMSCNNCARHVAEAIQNVPGVTSASVQLEQGRVTIRWSGPPNSRAAIQAVKDAGYEARELGASSPARDAENAWSPLTGWRFNLAVGSACLAPLIIGEWVFHVEMAPWFRWAAFLLALPVQIFCGARFYAGAWRQLKSRSSNMDTLVALGSTAAFGYSVAALLAGLPGHVYFMESIAIITLISAGHWIEAKAGAQAESAVRALNRLAPQMARRRNLDGSETETPVGDLRINDLVGLKPGDQVPVDGIMVEGDSTVDESMLTGESNPVEKELGENLYAGTVNQHGHLIMRVAATGESTALAHIIEAVRRAQQSRAEIQRLGDKVSSVFVPIVVAIAVVTALWWGLAFEQASRVNAALAHYLWFTTAPSGPLAAAFIHAAAVLIIACPCAMGLATPVAIMAGMNAAARRGILIRDGKALETAGELAAVVFDKTGTLTLGKPEVIAEENEVADGAQAKAEQVKLAAALARNSNHPLSRAVARLHPQDYPFEEWREARGGGVQGRLNSCHFSPGPAVIRLGSTRWLGESGVNAERSRAFEEKWAAKGGTILGLAVDDRLIGMFALRDPLKPGAAEVIQKLRDAGLNILMVSGDNFLTCGAIAAEAGIAPENITAEAKPERKAEVIRDLRARSRRVAFVGDGINDAPALEAADLGIAVGSASDVARAAADIVLLKSEIEAAPEAINLARGVLGTIRQNLFWAFFYNAIGIPLAALGFLSPVMCALAMGLSDLVVIGNSLRLLQSERFRK